MARLEPAVYFTVGAVLLYIVWNCAFITWGIYALSRDWSVDKNEACGQQTHILKYCSLNVFNSFVVVATYMLFPGGGEGARARALVLLTFHFAFATWGVLMWVALNHDCKDLLSNVYECVTGFQHVCIAHNSLFGILFLLHETYVGKKFRSDFTLLPERAKKTLDVSSGNPHYDFPPQSFADPNAESETTVVDDFSAEFQASTANIGQGGEYHDK